MCLLLPARAELESWAVKVHVEVVSFDAVTDPEEIALDLITLVG